MLQINKDGIARLWLTLSELKTIADPYYLFVAVNKGTANTVSFVLPRELSEHTDRVDYFQFDVNEYFSSADAGEYQYTVYEQYSSTNTDIAETIGIVQSGLLMYTVPSAINVIQRDSKPTFIVRKS